MIKYSINYENPEIFRGPIKTEIINKSYGNGHLSMKVFKILSPKKGGGGGGGQGSDGDSDSGALRGGAAAGNSNNKNVRALIDETNKKIEEMASEEIHKRIVQMKSALEQVKKGIRHPSARVKPSNIYTPSNFEQAEILGYIKEIKEIDRRYREIKKQEVKEELKIKQEANE